MGAKSRCNGLDVSSWGEQGGDYSLDGKYRWSFEKCWSSGPLICWIGLNPGTGDSEKRRRPTLERMVWWSKRLSGGGIVIVNLFGYRTTYPAELREAARRGVDIVGVRNDVVIDDAVQRAAITVLAWGRRGSLLERGAVVAERVPDPFCLGLTATGEPRHPLYVPMDTEVRPYRTQSPMSAESDSTGKGCPYCGSPALPLLFGLPGSQAMVAYERGRLLLGGCIVEGENWGCTGPERHMWRDDDEAAWSAALDAALRGHSQVNGPIGEAGLGRQASTTA